MSGFEAVSQTFTVAQGARDFAAAGDAARQRTSAMAHMIVRRTGMAD